MLCHQYEVLMIYLGAKSTDAVFISAGDRARMTMDFDALAQSEELKSSQSIILDVSHFQFCTQVCVMIIVIFFCGQNVY